MHDPRELLPLPVVPGDRLGSESDFSAGYGTYTSRGFIYSALVGCKVIQPGPAVHDDSGTHLVILFVSLYLVNLIDLSST